MREIEVVRAIEDGRFAFLHVYQRLDGGAARWVTADLFDTDADGRLVEHWDVIAADHEPNEAGRTMVDGPRQAQDLSATDDNKALVRAFVDEVLLGGRLERTTSYLAGEDFREHRPGGRDGAAAFAEHLSAQIGARGDSCYRRLHRLVGQGNLVVTYGEAVVDQAPSAVFDLYRVSAGRIAERWQVAEPIAAPQKWNNSGKF